MPRQPAHLGGHGQPGEGLLADGGQRLEGLAVGLDRRPGAVDGRRDQPHGPAAGADPGTDLLRLGGLVAQLDVARGHSGARVDTQQGLQLGRGLGHLRLRGRVEQSRQPSPVLPSPGQRAGRDQDREHRDRQQHARVRRQLPVHQRRQVAEAVDRDEDTEGGQAGALRQLADDRGALLQGDRHGGRDVVDDEERRAAQRDGDQLARRGVLEAARNRVHHLEGAEARGHAEAHVEGADVEPLAGEALGQQLSQGPDAQRAGAAVDAGEEDQDRGLEADLDAARRPVQQEREAGHQGAQRRTDQQGDSPEDADVRHQLGHADEGKHQPGDDDREVEAPADAALRHGPGHAHASPPSFAEVSARVTTE